MENTIKERKQIDFIKSRKICIIISACLIVAGIICNFVMGTNLSIDFAGGTIVSYSYSGEVDTDSVKTLAKGTLGADLNVTKTSDYSGETQLITIELVDNSSVSNEALIELDTALAENYPDNSIEKYSSNSVDPTVGKGFFIKCIFAAVLGALIVTLYVGLRFRKIGGFSAAVFALLCLLHDILIAYFSYVVFRFDIDDNFIAVILTLFGYSLNGTIVIYDRIRENNRIYGKVKPLDEIVNISINQTFTRNLFTTLTTFVAIMCVCIVAWVGGVTSIISFALPMAIGLVSGCYSSVFLSSPLWAAWKKVRSKKENKR